MARGEMLGEVVGQVVGSFAPEDEELALLDAVPDPIKTHVDGFGSALLDGVVCDSRSGGVVGGRTG